LEPEYFPRRYRFVKRSKAFAEHLAPVDSYISKEAHKMSETTPHDRSDDVSDELRDTRDDASRAADRAKDEVAEGADRVKDGVSDVADKVSDTVEDMIPGDSDRDGH
jgi:gas vesicle protein